MATSANVVTAVRPLSGHTEVFCSSAPFRSRKRRKHDEVFAIRRGLAPMHVLQATFRVILGRTPQILLHLGIPHLHPSNHAMTFICKLATMATSATLICSVLVPYGARRLSHADTLRNTAEFIQPATVKRRNCPPEGNAGLHPNSNIFSRAQQHETGRHITTGPSTLSHTALAQRLATCRQWYRPRAPSRLW